MAYIADLRLRVTMTSRLKTPPHGRPARRCRRLLFTMMLATKQSLSAMKMPENYFAQYLRHFHTL